jgi:hypothetical protein
VERAGAKSWGGGAPAATAPASADKAAGEGGAPQGKRRGGGLEMTVTFTPGLDSLGTRLLEAKREAAAREGESVWQAYLR